MINLKCSAARSAKFNAQNDLNKVMKRPNDETVKLVPGTATANIASQALTMVPPQPQQGVWNLSQE